MKFSLLELMAFVTIISIGLYVGTGIAKTLKAADYFRQPKTYRQVQIERLEAARQAILNERYGDVKP